MNQERLEKNNIEEPKQNFGSEETQNLVGLFSILQKTHREIYPDLYINKKNKNEKDKTKK